MNSNHNFKKLILIDLDGVLNNYKGDYKKDFIHSPKNGVKDFLKNISENYEIKIFTTRNKMLTTKWLMENKLDIYISDVTNIKENGAYLFVDDRCICFKNNFKDLEKKIKEFNPYWK